MSRDVWARSRSRSGRLVLFSIDALCVHKYKSVLHIARWYNWCKSIRPRKTATETRRCRLKHLYQCTCSRVRLLLMRKHFTDAQLLLHQFTFGFTNARMLCMFSDYETRMCECVLPQSLQCKWGKSLEGMRPGTCDAQVRIRVSVKRFCELVKRIREPVALFCVNKV